MKVLPHEIPYTTADFESAAWRWNIIQLNIFIALKRRRPTQITAYTVLQTIHVAIILLKHTFSAALNERKELKRSLCKIHRLNNNALCYAHINFSSNENIKLQQLNKTFRLETDQIREKCVLWALMSVLSVNFSTNVYIYFLTDLI